MAIAKPGNQHGRGGSSHSIPRRITFALSYITVQYKVRCCCGGIQLLEMLQRRTSTSSISGTAKPYDAATVTPSQKPVQHRHCVEYQYHPTRHWLMQAIVHGVTISISHGVTFSYRAIRCTTWNGGHAQTRELLGGFVFRSCATEQPPSIPPPLITEALMDGSSNPAPQAHNIGPRSTRQKKQCSGYTQPDSPQRLSLFGLTSPPRDYWPPSRRNRINSNSTADIFSELLWVAIAEISGRDREHTVQWFVISFTCAAV